jgi:glutamate carboxypeptidase
MHIFERYAIDKQAEIITLLQEMVECESPSDSAASVDRFVDLLINRSRDIATAETIDTDKYGRILKLEFKFGRPGKKQQILALGHSDTVWPLGTLKIMPFRAEQDRLWGPGILDMKSGLAFFLYAMKALRDLDVPVERKVVLLVVPDEEVGSPASRPYTEAEAKKSECVLVLEPGTGLTGKLKTARKGIGNYTVFVEGKAAHAGVDFTNGASAIVEAARQIEKMASLTNLHRGITVNPGVISGGTRSNVIAAEASIDVDVRAVRLKDSEAVEKKLRRLNAVDRRCRIRVEGGLNRPPMERTRAIRKLYEKARQIGGSIGFKLEESATGGGSDGNFTAALGVPTLDGLGGVGEGAHAINESILVNRIADRTALLASLVSRL